MNRKKLAKAVCIPVAVALSTSLAAEAADHPHVEHKQHEEEPRLTYDTPYSTTSASVVKLALWDSTPAGIPRVRIQKKK